MRRRCGRDADGLPNRLSILEDGYDTHLPTPLLEFRPAYHTSFFEYPTMPTSPPARANAAHTVITWATFVGS